MELEWLRSAFDVVTKDSAWAAFSLILFVAFVFETRANRRVTMRSTEALIALKTVIETGFAINNKKTPRRRAKA